jgi:hypothetical protein
MIRTQVNRILTPLSHTLTSLIFAFVTRIGTPEPVSWENQDCLIQETYDTWRGSVSFG